MTTPAYAFAAFALLATAITISLRAFGRLALRPAPLPIVWLMFGVFAVLFLLSMNGAAALTPQPFATIASIVEVAGGAALLLIDASFLVAALRTRRPQR